MKVLKRLFNIKGLLTVVFSALIIAIIKYFFYINEISIPLLDVSFCLGLPLFFSDSLKSLIDILAEKLLGPHHMMMGGPSQGGLPNNSPPNMRPLRPKGEDFKEEEFKMEDLIKENFKKEDWNKLRREKAYQGIPFFQGEGFELRNGHYKVYDDEKIAIRGFFKDKKKQNSLIHINLLRRISQRH